MTYGDYPSLDGVKKVLVIKLRHLGDVLLTGPVFSGLKQALPEAEIDAYIYQEARPILEGHPAVHELICYDRTWKKQGLWTRFKQEWALWQKIRQGKYDLVINLTEGDRGALAARQTGAKIRVGVDPKGKWQKRVFTHTVKRGHSLRHTVEKNLDAIRRIGIFPALEDRELFFQVPIQAQQAVQKRIGQQPFVLIHPTSRWRFKCWPQEKMRALSQELLRQGKRLVFTAGPDAEEKAMVRSITQGLDVLNLAGEISLKELGAWIGQSELVLCVDSVPFHLANALKKPVVAIFGPTSDVTWGPWRNPHARVVAQNWSCRPCYQDGCGGSKLSDCLSTLPVSQVLEAIEQMSKKNEYCL